MKSLLCALGIMLLTMNSSAQTELHRILSEAVYFRETVEEAESYFALKHPGCSAAELCSGPHRDGEFVKFMRWKAFWSERLNPDGTLGDITAYHREHGSQNRGGDGIYADIEWTNISYEDYITGQIGMGRTTSIGFHPTEPNTFYVGAAIGGVWKTEDGGQTYVSKGDELPFLAVSSIVVRSDDPSTLYIALSDHVWYGPPSIGIYKSTDGGDTWEPTSLSFSFGQGIRVYWMIADPANPNRMFVATSNGLYRTDDGFNSVVSVLTLPCTDVKFNPNDPSIVYLGLASGGFYRSIDGGQSFSPIGSIGTGSCMIAVTPIEPYLVYVRSGGSMKKSTDAGLTFGPSVPLPENDGMLIFSGTSSNTLITGNFEVWKSANGGDDFYVLSNWLGSGGLPLIHVDQRNIFLNPLQPDLIYLCNDGGVYALNVENDEFTNLSDGLEITQFYDIAVSQTDENVIGGGSQDNGNVYRNSNGTWVQYAPTGDGMNQEIDPTNANVRYWAYQLGDLRRFQNGSSSGISPNGESGNGAWETPYKIDPNNSNTLVCAYQKVYKSPNKGTTWTVISPDLVTSGDLEQLAIAPSNSNRIYVSRGNKIWVKDLFTNEWTLEYLPDSNISDLEVDPVDMDVVYATVAGYSDGEKVFRSTDACDTWENISGSLPNVSTGAIEIYKNVPGGLFVGTDAGVYYKDNTLNDWEFYGNIPNTRVEDIEIQYAAQKIRIGTHGRGVLEAPVSIGLCTDAASDADGDGICNDYDICSNFDDTLLGTPCNDEDPDTQNDIYTGCNLCEGIYYVGLKEDDRPHMLIYPNPSLGTITIESESWSGSFIQIYNSCGQVVYSSQMQGSSQRVVIPSVETSVYTVRLYNPATGTQSIQKLIIE